MAGRYKTENKGPIKSLLQEATLENERGLN